MIRIPKFGIFIGYSQKQLMDDLGCTLDMDLLVYPHPEKVDDIRELTSMSCCLSKDTLFILDKADKLNTQAQNALLKLAEEPPDKCYICLLVEDATKLLPTIKSRAIINVFGGNVESEELPSNLVDLAKTLLEKLGVISYTNIFNVLHHVEKEDYEKFLFVMCDTWEKHFMSGLGYFDEWCLIIDYKNKVTNSTNYERHIKTLLQELKEMRG